MSQQPDATGAHFAAAQQALPGTYGAHVRREAVAGKMTRTGSFPAVGRAPRPELSVRDRLLRDLLGERRLALGRRTSDRFWALFGALLVTAVAAGARLWELGRPGKLVFDETYYVKEGWSLASLGFEAAWPDEPNPAFEAGDVSSYKTDEAEYVVHPSVGKWMIAIGMRLMGGAENPMAWRIASAVIGVLAVLLLVRIARRLFSSTLLGLVAGLLLAVDGEAIVHSRTGLLDQFLMFWVLVAFGCLVLDREWARRRLADRVAQIVEAGGAIGKYGPRIGFRGWRFAAAVSLGLACGVKWSGLYFVAAFCVLTVVWDMTARRTAGVERWWEDALVVDAVPAALIMLPTVAAVYVASWSAWFAHPKSYLRDWAAVNGVAPPGWWPDWGWAQGAWEAGRSLGEYHRMMWDFHTGLSSDHNYASHPLGWIVQWRPTSFYWDKYAPGQGPCPTDAAGDCATAVTSLGNPLLWWLGALAIPVVLVLAIRFRDWRGAAALTGIAAGWLPWFQYSWPLADRTIFTFYTIVFTPFVILTLVYLLAVGLERTSRRSGDRRIVCWLAGVLVVLIVGVSVLYYPIWTAMPVPYEYWQRLMLLPSWI
ncbi:dolichyl-phosphate-mannose--protein mannosyltransferase [Promicromonospora vindobonensis]|uniref:Polyprenol-phosphate-mannose--protein mannosyltransferase n=1 Tax=Promicromonospora vindobonensis TaxID=195748 RepID=A0ABW5VQT3_9MICO